MPPRNPEPDEDDPTDLELQRGTEEHEVPEDIATEQSRSGSPSSGARDLSGSLPPIPRAEGEDIYGEDDYPEEDESYQGTDDGFGDSNPSAGSTATGRKPVGNTRPSDLSGVDADSVEPSERTRAGPPFRLEIVDGPDEGKTKRFGGVRLVVGRVSGCELKLSDQSVSRRHLEFIQSEKGVLLRDLASGNGTRVNGEKVAEKLLEDGDEISIGKTKIRFVDELAQYMRKKEAAEAKELEALAEAAAAARKVDEERQALIAAAAPDEAARKSGSTEAINKPLPLLARIKQRWNEIPKNVKYGTAAAAVLLPLIALMVLWGTNQKDPRLLMAEEQIALARKAIKDGQLESALTSIRRARAAVPNVDKDNLLDTATRERDAEASLKRTEAYLAQGRFGEASTEVQKVAGVGVERMARAKKLSADIETRNDDFLYAKAKEALAQRDFANAQAIIAGLSPARNRELAAQMASLRGRNTNDQVVQDRVRRENVEQLRKQVETDRVVYEDQALNAVARKFHAGDFKRATLECDRVIEQFAHDGPVRARATELKTLIPAFARSYEDGQRKFKDGALETSVRPLRRAFELYQQINFPGALGSLIEEELASAALSSARSAFNRSDFAAAAGGYRETLRLSPNEARAKEGLARLQETAEDLYTQGYVVRETDRRLAVSKFKLVLEITSSNSSVYQKAKEQLASMQP